MADNRQELDANEPATPFKLEKARERGSIVRSGDVTFAVVMFVAIACVYGLGARMSEGLARMLGRGIGAARHGDLDAATAMAWMHGLARETAFVVAPALFAIWVAAVLTGALQARGVFSAHPLKPDFSRLSPAHGLKRLFSARSLQELVRGVARLVVGSVAMTLWMTHHARELARISFLPPRAALGSGLALLGSALLLLAGIVAVFAVIDFALNWRDFMRRMRMSRRELKEELKERQGDPRIRKRLRELRMQWLKRSRQVSKVRGADVLVTNPTHYAVAIEYRHGEMPAPRILAKGAGELALRMRTEARRHRVPVVEHPPLARALYALAESEVFVPEEHFNQVARVLRWVFAARGARRGGVPT